MKRAALSVYLLCLSAFFFAVNALNALTIPASEDSYTAPRNTLSHSTNNANSLIVDATRKSYLYFDLSDIPQDAVVRWAKLRLFLPTVRTPGAGLSVHLVTGTWNESTRLADVPSILAGSLGMIAPDKMASRRFVTVDVKDTVQKWINGGTLNEGFAIQPIVKTGSPTASVMLTSKEGPVFGLPAELDIEFQPEGGVDKPVAIGQLPDSVKALLNPPPVTLQNIDQLPVTLRTFLSPSITSQPFNPPSRWSGLSVQAQGLGNLSYQWKRDGVAVTGGTSAHLSVVFLQSGTYTVDVSNGFATVVSKSVTFSEPKFTDLFALVTGGTLPASSPLGAVSVDTFYIGKTEVTWGEWQTVRAWAVANGYTDLANVGQGVGDSYPVTDVNWYDVVKWCNARSEKEGKTPVYQNGSVVYRTGNVSEPAIVASANGYRLPSEKEWEFAARGGTQTQGYTYSGSNDLNAVGWYSGNAGGSPHGVGMKQSNELGISDMSGNVWEWCFTLEELTQTRRMLRGGAWDYGEAESIPLSARGHEAPSIRYYHIGFRVATSGEYALGITAQPSVSADGTTLSVEAAGAGTLTYQWRLNGAAIAGGTSSQLSTQGLQSGTYTVIVSNGFASLTSSAIQYPPSPIGAFALVTGGTLPASSQLGALPVDTFYIGKTEVTWGEWQTVRAWAVANGYTDLANVGGGAGDNYPVDYVNWFDVVKWCNARSEKEGKTPAYMANGAVYKTGEVTPTEVASANGYRLPSEKEWEFAARGGTQTQGYTYSGSNDLNAVGWYGDNSGYAVHEVGKKLANELGIYDMSGNLLEWSGSWYPGYEGSLRVMRGGRFDYFPEGCAVAYRFNSLAPEIRDGFGVCFRVALSSVT
jgi:formylglycine-generating enzyme required for sulfatase activity